MQAPLDPRAFRAAMGRFATGVTIVATADQGCVHAMTASSFLSVSLDPPLVLVSIRREARMHGLLALGRPFGVSVLAAEQRELSDHFAGRPAGQLVAGWDWENEAPLLPGAVARVAARVVAAHPAGDHTLFVGLVEALGQGEGEPLIFHRGRYERLAEAL